MSDSIGNSIGSDLGHSMDLEVQRVLAQAGSQVGVDATGATPGGSQFASIMQAQLTQEMAARGVTLPPDPTSTSDPSTSPSGSVPETADAIWARVSLQDQAQNGRIDAIMNGLQQSDDAENGTSSQDGNPDAGTDYFSNWF